MIQIIDRYILKEFLKFLTGSLILFTGVGMITKILDSLRWIGGYRGEALHVWLYYFYNIPFIMTIVMIPSFLLSTSYLTSQLIQNKELMVIRSCSRSIKRCMQPIVLFSFFFSFFYFIFIEFVAFPSNLKAYEQKNHMRNRPLDYHAWRARNKLHSRSHNRTFYMRSFKPTAKKVYGLHIVEVNQQNQIKRIIQAEESSIEAGAWEIRNGTILTFENSVFKGKRYYQKKVIDIPEDITYFQHNYFDQEEANIFQLLELVNLRKKRGESYSLFLVEFYWRLGFPFICFFFVIIGVSVAIKVPSGGLPSSLSITIVLAFLYFFVMFYTKSLGASQIINPLWAGMLSNFFAGAIALYFWFFYID